MICFPDLHPKKTKTSYWNYTDVNHELNATDSVSSPQPGGAFKLPVEVMQVVFFFVRRKFAYKPTIEMDKCWMNASILQCQTAGC